MKTGNQFVKAVFAVTLMAMPAVPGVRAQQHPDPERSLADLLSGLPTDLVSRETIPLHYRVTSTVHNRSIGGEPRSKVRLTGEFTRLVEDSEVKCRWNDVRVAAPSDPAAPFTKGVLLDYMEDFTYLLSGEILQEDLYRDIPPGDLKHLIKTLVWDAATFEPPFWDHFGVLALNQSRLVSDFEDVRIEMGNWGMVRMRDLEMTWIGVSQANEEPCALLLYRSFANPVQSNAGMAITGRSLYWGCIWVSLVDKQVEYATLNEDVMMEASLPGNTAKNLTNLQREVEFKKIP